MERSEVIGPKVDAILFDLLMGVMDSVETWSSAAPDPATGLHWRDAVTARMSASPAYLPYEGLVDDAARALGLPAGSTERLLDRWAEMEPRPDARAVADLRMPYGFVTNCSARLAGVAAARSSLRPAFVLSAEEAGCFKPNPRIYGEACRRLGLAPDRVLFVAGSPYDADGARDAGLPAVLVLRRADQADAAGSHLTVDSLVPIVDGANGEASAGW